MAEAHGPLRRIVNQRRRDLLVVATYAAARFRLVSRASTSTVRRLDAAALCTVVGRGHGGGRGGASRDNATARVHIPRSHRDPSTHVVRAPRVRVPVTAVLRYAPPPRRSAHAKSHDVYIAAFGCAK